MPAQAADKSGKSDPYVVITLGDMPKDERPKTDVKKQTLDPEWFKEFEFPLDKPPKPGSFCLYSAAAGASVCVAAGARTFVTSRNKNGLRSV